MHRARCRHVNLPAKASPAGFELRGVSPERLDPLPFQHQLIAAIGAGGEMGLDPFALGFFELAGRIPGEEFLRLVVRPISNVWVSDRHGQSQSAKLPGIAFLRRRRAWNTRVFTVSAGQPTMSAISRYPSPWK